MKLKNSCTFSWMFNGSQKAVHVFKVDVHIYNFIFTYFYEFSRFPIISLDVEIMNGFKEWSNSFIHMFTFSDDIFSNGEK